MFITFEGGEGTGKTTIIKKIENHLKKLDHKVVLTREPGGTGSNLSESIRNLVLDPKYKHVNKYTESLLYAASRAQHLDEVILPALNDGKIVLCDRYIDSSLAYQGYARELGIEYIEKINKYAMDHLPNLTFLIDVDPEIGINRVKKRSKYDRLDQETLEFHNKVRTGYGKVLDKYPNRIIKIDGSKSLEEIETEIFNLISDRL
ncbi:MAG TPA: dTMP kinase [Acholeplasmataceae bacterium]|nr:dTMP kinase [Acholeplasmataceae bacterium]